MTKALYKPFSHVRKLQLGDKPRLCMIGRSGLLLYLMEGAMAQ